MKNMKTSIQKILTALLAPGCLVFLAGCVLTSVHPFYTSKDLIMDPRLAATWIKDKESDERWTFTPDDTNSYKMMIVSGSDTNVLQAHLFKLHDQLFLDLFQGDVECPAIAVPPTPAHLLMRVTQLAPTLKCDLLDLGYVRDLLQKDPGLTRHVVPNAGAKPEDRRVVLTGNTPELQKFLVQMLPTKEAWGGESEFSREVTTDKVATPEVRTGK